MTPSVARVAVITGAARRMGAELARHLHQAGFRVVLHYHHSAVAAVALVDSWNQVRDHSAIALEADLCSPGAGLRMLKAAAAEWGRLDLLVNKAAIFYRVDIDWEQMWQCNVQAPYYLSLAALPYLASSEGSIINITDTHAQTPLRGYAAYCQTKAALAMQTRALAQEFAPKVRVNAIAPGAILWPEGDNQLDVSSQKKIISKTRLQRHGHPDNIAQAMLYLVNNTYVTGQSLQVDGGRHL